MGHPNLEHFNVYRLYSVDLSIGIPNSKLKFPQAGGAGAVSVLCLCCVCVVFG